MLTRKIMDVNFISSEYFSIPEHISVALQLFLFVVFISCIIKKWKYSSEFTPNLQRIDNQIVLITGATRGIGKEAAITLLKQGAHVIIGCRNTSIKNDIKEELIKTTENENVSVYYLDLTSFKSIRKFSKIVHQEHAKIDVLINNAGAFYLPLSSTEDGYETTMQTNYLGPFLLTHLLLDMLKAGEKSQIINVTSHGYKRIKTVNSTSFYANNSKFNKFDIYCQSKLAVNLSSVHLSKLLGSEICVNLLTPGNVDTDIFRYFPLNNGIFKYLLLPLRKLLYKNTHQGAQTITHLVLGEHYLSVTGKYFSDCQEEKLLPFSCNEEKANDIFNKTMLVLGIDKF